LVRIVCVTISRTIGKSELITVAESNIMFHIVGEVAI